MTDEVVHAFQGFLPSGSTMCPRCDYELEGLPTVGACPECGLRYDTNSRVWEKRQQMGVFPFWTVFKNTLAQTAFLIGIIYIPGFFDDAHARIFGQPVLYQVSYSTLLMLVALSGLGSADWYINNRSYRKVLAVMPDVLIQSRWWNRRKEIPMNQVIKAQRSSLIDTFKPISVYYRPPNKRGRVRIRGISIPGGDAAEMDAVLMVINQHPRVLLG